MLLATKDSWMGDEPLNLPSGVAPVESLIAEVQASRPARTG